ncbi:MAG TPA: uroporphyrinogen-III decarboxylase-like protein, partial [Phycisphaerae bacterium]|nr:uroporphyrinogen-III decarboxylase-like protein [Phycisphaerae bacterium]
MSRPTKRDVVIEAMEFRPPPYVPWAWDMTLGCAERMAEHLGTRDLAPFIDTHFLNLGPDIGYLEPLGNDLHRDRYGVVWDRSVDKDIGTPLEWPIRRPEDLAAYEWPDPAADDLFADIPEALAARPDLFSRYMLGFSLYERAWTMRGLMDLLTDMAERPEFVEDLLDRIVEHNLVQIRKAL